MEIKEKIIEIISNLSDLEDASQYLQDNDDLSKIGMNSILFIKTIVALETEFDFEFEEEALDYKKFTSLDSLCSYVEKQLR